MIAIVSGPGDSHAERVESMLQHRAAPCTRIDHRDFPASARSSVRFAATGITSARWRPPTGPSVDLAALRAVWWRRPGRPASPPAVTAPGAAEFVDAESADFVDDVWDLDLVPALPAARPVVRRAQYKARQLALAGRLGFELPATLITNDPDEALEFVATHGACSLVSKQVGFTDLAHAGQDSYVRYTERVSTRDLAHLQALRHCPVILQVEVPKRHELRVTVVGTRLFVVAIHSQANPRTALDWRRYDDRATRHEITTLPDDVAALCLALCAAQGLRYAALDLIVTPEGRYVFVEINPSGQYLWLEDLTGAPISAAIADELMTAAST